MLFRLVVAVLMAFIVTPAFAGPIWQGRAIIFSKSGTCANYDPVGSKYAVRFQPRGLGTNGNNSRMGWFSDDYAVSFETTNAAFDATARTVKFTSIWTGSGSPNFPVTVKFNTQSPATILVNSPTIIIAGQITNFDFQQGCTVSFRLVLAISPTEN